MEKRTVFHSRFLPYLLLAPQIVVTLIFFIWPSVHALGQSFISQDAFGLRSHFVWFANFQDLFTSPEYLQSLKTTLIFSLAVTISTLAAGLAMALLADRIIRGETAYKTLLIWPYAVAPAVAGILWRFLFNPAVGILAYLLACFGYNWNYMVNGQQAMLLVVIAAAWQQFSFNFVFYLAGMQSIPDSILEAAMIDGAGSWKRIRTIILPLLSPTTFFLMIMNLIYAFFETFGIIHVVTKGGPAGATEILVYKVYSDGFVGLDIGSSAAQSVILMLIVIGLTAIQFRYVERRVHY